MNVLSELQRRARHVVGPAIGICAAAYFAYHGVNGDRGLVALTQVSQKVEAARRERDDLRRRREALEARVGRLSPRGLDLDLLDERARIMLNYGHPDDIVILYDAE
ncbi:MAG: septum formation initiator family protein [Rhodobacterales bacterium]|nr:septum formation initiator family protein [Rhodobacterales bacterium]